MPHDKRRTLEDVEPMRPTRGSKEYPKMIDDLMEQMPHGERPPYRPRGEKDDSEPKPGTQKYIDRRDREAAEDARERDEAERRRERK